MLVRARSYPKMKKKAGGGLGGRVQRLPPNALAARTALQMSTWRSFFVVVVVVVVLVLVLGCCVPGFSCC